MSLPWCDDDVGVYCYHPRLRGLLVANAVDCSLNRKRSRLTDNVWLATWQTRRTVPIMPSSSAFAARRGSYRTPSRGTCAIGLALWAQQERGAPSGRASVEPVRGWRAAAAPSACPPENPPLYRRGCSAARLPSATPPLCRRRHRHRSCKPAQDQAARERPSGPRVVAAAAATTMSFLSKALRRAEVFLEQVDESVAQASRRAVVEGATGAVDDDQWTPMSDDPLTAGLQPEQPAPDSDADAADAAGRAPPQRRRGIANIRRADRRAGAAPPPDAPGVPSPQADDGAAGEQASAAGTHGSVGSARSPPGSIVSTHVAESVAATDEPVEGKAGGGEDADADADAWGEFDIPDAEVEDGPAVVAGAAGAAGGAAGAAVAAVATASAVPEGRTEKALESAPSASAEPRGEPDLLPVTAGGASQNAQGAADAAALATSDDGPGPDARVHAPSSLVAPPGVEAAAADEEIVRASRSDAVPDSDDSPKLDSELAATRQAPSEASATRELDSAGGGACSVASLDARTPLQSDAESRPSESGFPDGAAHDDSVRALISENDELRKELELAEEDFDNLLKERSKLVQNLKSLKEVIAEQEETLEDKSTEVRRLGEAMVELRDEKSALQKKLKEINAKAKDDMDLIQKKLNSQLATLQSEFDKTKYEEERLRAENAEIRDALSKGREVDMMTADGARDEASKAQRAYEAEVIAHRQTREALETRQEALDSEAAIAAEAIGAAQRKADEALAGLASARESQRAAESRLTRITTARDAALARVEDLTKELAPYKSSGDGQPPGHEELQSMQETVVELEHALEAKNVELTRLEGDVENMRSIVSRRNSSPTAKSPGGVVGAGGEFANGHEVEQKLRHMADSALRKQAQVEVLRLENKALQYQLDTERKRTREAQAMAAVATSSRHNLRGGFRGLVEDEERGERGFGVREGPIARFRAPRSWPMGVARFLSSLDKLTARALGFLRKEPIVRIALLVYVVAVHVVLYSLLHYHVERAMSDPAGTVKAHPQEKLVHGS